MDVCATSTACCDFDLQKLIMPSVGAGEFHQDCSRHSWDIVVTRSAWINGQTDKCGEQTAQKHNAFVDNVRWRTHNIIQTEWNDKQFTMNLSVNAITGESGWEIITMKLSRQSGVVDARTCFFWVSSLRASWSTSTSIKFPCTLPPADENPRTSPSTEPQMSTLFPSWR